MGSRSETYMKMLPLHAKDGRMGEARQQDRFARVAHRLSNALRSKKLMAVCTFFTTTLFLLVWLSLGVKEETVSRPRLRPSDYPRHRRSQAVRDSFRHAYWGYEKYAMPADELSPLTNTSKQNFAGWGVSVFDALDTLHLMGLEPEFDRAVKHISTLTFDQPPDQYAPFFESVIRYLGGLLSAYALSNRTVLLEKANELGVKLKPAFNSPSGLPAYAINTQTGQTQTGVRAGNTILAEAASCQMEYKYLAHLTGNPTFYSMSDRVMSILQGQQLDNGLWGTIWSIYSGKQIDDHFTMGALADSAYEYLLKQYLLSGRTETRLRDMYLKAASGAIRNLIYTTPNRNMMYITDIRGGRPSHAFEHLSCFFPGLLALGASELRGEMDEGERELHMWAAEGLAHSCWVMYADQASGLGPEEALMLRLNHDEDKTAGLWVKQVELWKEEGRPTTKPPGVFPQSEPQPQLPQREKEYLVRTGTYLLRPETVESMYVMWRTTRDEVWRDRAWDIYKAIEEGCRTPVGYASVSGVYLPKDAGFRQLDEMPSYAFAETWKYLYLIFLENDPFPANEYVFNTEAHPFRIFSWNDEEKVAYNLTG